MDEMTTDPNERAEYIAEQYDVPFRAGWALQLAELGFSNSGIAKQLNVTESTVSNYQAMLEDRISERVWYPVTSKPRFDTFPTCNDEPEYAGDHIDYAPEFRERERPINRGMDLSEIPDELISISG